MRYLSECVPELPANTVINKGLTGCGATTLAIEQERDTIIAVPYKALVDNKALRHKEVLLCLHGGTSNFRSEIEDYLAAHPCVKIMTTYDSLPKVCRFLQELGLDPYRRMQLVIDEWHLLLMSYGFRGEAIRGVLNEASKFQSVTYLSATPIEERFWFPEMSGFSKWDIK